jgi:hypothetical protein
MILNDDEGISAEEKIKQLIDLENLRRKELDEKKADFEKKKKELEALEDKQKKETASTRKKIEEKIEELAQEQKQRFDELEEIRKKREEESLSLEKQVELESGKSAPEKETLRGYGDAIDEILRGKPGFYEVTNYNVMNRLESIADEAGNRPLSQTEKNFLDVLQYHAEQLNKDDFYKNKEGANYLKRELAKIDLINKTIKDRENQPGDYQP